MWPKNSITYGYIYRYNCNVYIAIYVFIELLYKLLSHCPVSTYIIEIQIISRVTIIWTIGGQICGQPRFYLRKRFLKQIIVVFGQKWKIAHFARFVQFFICKNGTIEKWDNTIPNFTMVRNKGYSGSKSVFPVPFNLHYRHTREEIYEQINRFAALLPHNSGMTNQV